MIPSLLSKLLSKFKRSIKTLWSRRRRSKRRRRRSNFFSLFFEVPHDSCRFRVQWRVQLTTGLCFVFQLYANVLKVDFRQPLIYSEQTSAQSDSIGYCGSDQGLQKAFWLLKSSNKIRTKKKEEKVLSSIEALSSLHPVDVQIWWAFWVVWCSAAGFSRHHTLVSAAVAVSI